ncbi:MAG: MarR family winged helix-turn-helix transcriptional regulator [Candidatus Marsarchaeota archaeon]|jgi:predicted transcriptional regulator|nr:MarR family winged helix-turn-helix transcriptional regulator [Candidatus Marsarchaeota archaeon]MCL5112819.1 MarR family winged helix-turn-helix transcriptional regulator [Candidatus Marsarchaeota archaeon]
MANGNRLLLMEKQATIILTLKSNAQEWNISSLAKAAGTTYVHACNFLILCESKGIVSSERHGRIKTIKLTEKGARLAEMVDGIHTIVNEKAQVPQQPGPSM